VDATWNVYILRCADGSLYTGIATDVERRVAEHAGGVRGAKYLKGRLPVTIVFQYEVRDRSCASRIEHRIKRLPKCEKERLVGMPRLLRTWIQQSMQDSGAGSAGTGC